MEKGSEKIGLVLERQTHQLRATTVLVTLLLLFARHAAAGGVSSISSPPLSANGSVASITASAAQPVTTRGTGLLLLAPKSATELDSADTAEQALTGDDAAASGEQDQPPDEQQRLDEHKRELKVNPVTGLAEASQSSYVPLTGSERLKLYLKMNYWSLGAYFGPFFTALVLDQATGSPKQWGGGFSGYGRRVTSRLGNAILQGSIQAPLAAVLHQDVRYVGSSEHGFKRRARHAILYGFLTYNGEGHPTLNIANLSAYYASTAISTVWLPGHYNVGTYALGNGTEQVALSVPVNLLQEFWPELSRHLFRRH